ncbi:MAG: hypothetical protein ACK559_40100, partial [bacterium]
GAPQGLGLQHAQAQVTISRPGLVVPAADRTLGLHDQPQSLVERGADRAVVRHAVGLTEHERRQAVVVHVAFRNAHVEQPRRLGVGDHIIERPLHGRPVLAVARGVARRHEGQGPRGHEAQIVDSPVARSALRFREEGEPLFDRRFALGRDLPFLC